MMALAYARGADPLILRQAIKFHHRPDFDRADARSRNLRGDPQ